MIYLITSGHHQLMRLLQSETDNVFMKSVNSATITKTPKCLFVQKKRLNLTSTPLFKGLDVPTWYQVTKAGFLQAHGSNFGQMPFLLPPVNHVDISRSWAKARWAQVCRLTTEPRLILLFVEYNKHNFYKRITWGLLFYRTFYLWQLWLYFKYRKL